MTEFSIAATLSANKIHINGVPGFHTNPWILHLRDAEALVDQIAALLPAARIEERKRAYVRLETAKSDMRVAAHLRDQLRDELTALDAQIDRDAREAQRVETEPARLFDAWHAQWIDGAANV